MKPPTKALTRLLIAEGKDAKSVNEFACEMWLLAARFKDLLEKHAPNELIALQLGLYASAQQADGEVPYWSTRSGPPRKTPTQS